MPDFIVCIEGRNLLSRGSEKAETERLAFTTQRKVAATDESEAGEKAMQAVFDDQALKERIQNDEEDPPLLYVGEIRDAGAGENLSEADLAYEFFADEAIDLADLLSGAE